MRDLFIVAFFLILIVGAYVFFTHLDTDTFTHEFSERDLFSVDIWQERIQKKGEVEAFREFREALAKSELIRFIQHPASHRFGAALYHEGGSLSTCIVDDFEMSAILGGCVHEFVGQSVTEHGNAIVPKMIRDCDGATFEKDCVHALGHGLISFWGYEPANLETVLTICDTMDATTAFECRKGAYMEYHIRFMLDDSGPPMMRDPSDNHFDPCNSIDSKYRSSCIFALSSWWSTFSIREGKDENAVYEEIGSRCSQLGDQRDRQLCFAGAGKTTFFMAPATESVSLCKVASETRVDELVCRSTAQSEFTYRDPDEREKYIASICSGYTGIDLERCSAYQYNPDFFTSYTLSKVQ